MIGFEGLIFVLTFDDMALDFTSKYKKIMSLSSTGIYFGRFLYALTLFQRCPKI